VALADPPNAAQAAREAARRARRLGRSVLASWSRPATEHDAVAFFGQASATLDRVLWLRPATGEALVGLGAVCALTGEGPGRFEQVATAWRAMLADAAVEDPSHGPLLLGGFSFDPLRSSSATWSGFPDARMLLPRRMLALRDGAAWLTTNVVVDAEGRPDLSDAPGPEEPAHAAAEQTPLSAAAWQALVGSVARGIRHGQLGLEKVVLARVEDVRRDSPIDPRVVLRNLAQSYPGCTIFAVARGDACFLGATPERLITLRNGFASTAALAGSIGRGATPDEDRQLADRLLRDPKERAEHAVVVTALRDGLSAHGLCVRVVADARPRIHQLPNLQHLLTPVRGQVASGRDVFDLVARLHPTPAVGGFPTRRALELIRAHETLDRGWYAGPIGWVNAAGEGDFVVGIRSALLREGRASLFAGCGIVGESNPAAEFAESRWKLRPMRAALGLDT
jgi:salicylate biosynthesis isochorismate synthase